MRDFRLTQPFHHIRSQWGRYSQLCIPYLVSKLGKQTRCKNHEGHRWWVWESDKYTLYAHSTGDMDLDVPEGGSSTEAAQDLLWDLGLLDKYITRKEYAEWFQVGVELATPIIEDFPTETDADLKQFVRDFCDGKIFTDKHCRTEDASLVFMPLLFGAFSVPEPDEEKGIGETPAWQALQKLPPNPDEPKHEEKPVMANSSPYPTEVSKPTDWVVADPAVEDRLVHAGDPEEVQNIADLLADGMSGNALVDKYHEDIRRQNQKIQADYEQAVAEWQVACDVINKQNDQDITDHAAAMYEWEKREAKFEAQMQEWQRLHGIHQAAYDGFTRTRLQKMGLLYEYLDKALPRCVNGMPMFMSCHILSREGWDRVGPAINREFDRRKNMEL